MKNWVLVTGASKGIGEAISTELARRGWNVLLTARSEALLLELQKKLVDDCGVNVKVYPCDLTDREQRTGLVRWVKDHGELSALVNNAGFGSNGEFVGLAIDREIRQIELNVVALVDLTHRLLPLLQSQSHGYILNIASTAGFQPGPFMAVYYATKAFVLHFSEALSVELSDGNVSVTAHCPGATESEFASVAGNDKTVLFSKMNHVMSREVVAKHAVDSMLGRKVVSIAGFTNWLVAFSVRITPRWMVRSLAGWINQPGRWQ